VAAAGIAAVGLLACALALRWAALIAWSLAVLGGEYALWLAEHGGAVDTRSPLYGAVLLLVAELAYDGVDRSSVRAEPELHVRRGLQLGGVVVGALAAGTVVLATATIPVAGGVALTAVGVAAATLALLVIVRLAARVPGTSLAKEASERRAGQYVGYGQAARAQHPAASDVRPAGFAGPEEAGQGRER
jgi:hypothetical protein